MKLSERIALGLRWLPFRVRRSGSSIPIIRDHLDPPATRGS